MYCVTEKDGDIQHLVEDNLSEEKIAAALSHLEGRLTGDSNSLEKEVTSVILLFAGLFIEQDKTRYLALGQRTE